MKEALKSVGTPDLQSKLVEILTSIQGAVGEAKDFTLQQLPDVAQQYILFGMVSNVVGTLLALAVGVGLGWLCYRLFSSPNNRDRYGDITPGYGVGGTLSGIGSFVSVIVFIAGLEKTMLVLFAPKVWLLMEIAKLVK